MTQAELFLDIVLRRVGSDPQALDNLLGGRGKRNFHASVDYKGMLSLGLLTDIGQVEHEAVRANCGGQYHSNDVCGLDFMPVTCSQDTAPVYYYRTENATEDRVRIAYRWAPDGQTVATYLLIRHNGLWQLDGIDCETGDAFNWGDR
jgi:hypothetical protein